ncbi:MAG: Rieske (2Fe-2S) protein [Candidatus Bipolaricaulia bacterium]
MATDLDNRIRAGTLDELRQKGRLVASGGGHNIAIFEHEGEIYAVDNRCPHMGFPLSQGSLEDGILTCHWHHARFDVASGGTFDPWADDVRTFPVEVHDGEIRVDVTPQHDVVAHQRTRLREGLEQNIRLVVAKAAISLTANDVPSPEPFRIGVDVGVRYRDNGWGPGLTILTSLQNLMPYLDTDAQAQALYQGLSAVANDVDARAPKFTLRALPGAMDDPERLKRWFRQFVEVRDAEGAERCLVTAACYGLSRETIADMLFAAATDHRYLSVGHVLDFTNKALEALDHLGWDEPGRVGRVLGSLAPGYANATRMEEANSWRNPVDLVAILDDAFREVTEALEAGRERRGEWTGQQMDAFVETVLSGDPETIAEACLDALRAGATEAGLAKEIACAAARRIAQFPTSNEFADWDTALHTFTYANAVHQGLRRTPSRELLRGAFDAAMSVYLDRFLNMPPAKLPSTTDVEPADPAELRRAFLELLNVQQPVDDAGQLVAQYLGNDGDPDQLIATLAQALLREDRDFHTIQALDASVALYRTLRTPHVQANALIAAARYLAAHAPTARAQFQTFDIARRLHRGESLYQAA